MKRHWDCLQLRYEAPEDVKLEMLSRRAALSGNTSLNCHLFLVSSLSVAYMLLPVYAKNVSADLNRLSGGLDRHTSKTQVEC